MKVKRLREVDAKRFKIGDKITLEMDIDMITCINIYFATCHLVKKDRAFFLMDRCIARRPMMECTDTYTGFENSDLNKWLQECLLPCFPDEIKKNMIGGLVIPSYGMMFKRDDFYYEYIDPDEDKQLELMENNMDRLSPYRYGPTEYFLSNGLKTSSSYVCCIKENGEVDAQIAHFTSGVRVGFWLKNGKEN